MDDPVLGARVVEDGAALSPHALLGDVGGEIPQNGWVECQGHRFYLSWGEDGFRLVHPFDRPAANDHIENRSVLEQILDRSASLLVHGPRANGKSLVSALVAAGHAVRGRRVFYLSGIPTHDLGDGERIIHRVQPAGAPAGGIREACERWSPDVVCVDHTPTPDLAELVQYWTAAGLVVTMTLRASEPLVARESLRFLVGETAPWSLLSPWPAGDGPTFELLLETA
jgi:hypothetical protein